MKKLCTARTSRKENCLESERNELPALCLFGEQRIA